MTVKEWLNKGRKINIELQQLREERKQAFDLACNCTSCPSGEKVQSSQKNTTDMKYAAYTEYASIIDQKEFELLVHRSRMRRMINMLDNPTYRTLLSLRYINCKTWEQIAEDMHYSYVHIVHRLHPMALNEVNKYYLE